MIQNSNHSSKFTNFWSPGEIIWNANDKKSFLFYGYAFPVTLNRDSISVERFTGINFDVIQFKVRLLYPSKRGNEVKTWNQIAIFHKSLQGRIYLVDVGPTLNTLLIEHGIMVQLFHAYHELLAQLNHFARSGTPLANLTESWNKDSFLGCFSIDHRSFFIVQNLQEVVSNGANIFWHEPVIIERLPEWEMIDTGRLEPVTFRPKIDGKRQPDRRIKSDKPLRISSAMGRNMFS